VCSQNRLEFGEPRLGLAEFRLEMEQAGLLAGNRVAQGA
jgi:hypothetical protein